MIRSIWNYDFTQVLLTGASVDPDPAFVGVVQSTEHSSSRRIYTWVALPKPEGFYVIISIPGGATRGSAQGATFNLGLEVAKVFEGIA